MMRNSYAAFLWAALLAIFLRPAVYAQQAQTPPASGTAVKATAEEVLLDVVVRDKKGHEVKDLKPEDFQVLDNGEQKKITSFRLIDGKEAVKPCGARVPLEPLRQARLVTLIFEFRGPRTARSATVGGGHGSTLTVNDTDRGSLLTGSGTEARRLAREAAEYFLKQDLPSNVYTAVLAIDHKLEVLQPYTNDSHLLRKAIERATESQVTDFSADTERVRHELERAAGANVAGQAVQAPANASGTPSAAPSEAPALDPVAAPVLAKMLLQTLSTVQSNAMMESGRVEIFALQDAMKEQYRIPGRKTILYISEGFTIPQGFETAFNELISAANRSNVSLYIMDAHGLGTLSSNQEAVDQLRSASQASRDEQSNRGNQSVSKDVAQLMDTTLESTRSNYQMTLANLADSTGGFLIANTNDFRSPLRRLAEDLQTYYEISYAPGISNYDGSFHKVAVKMASGNLRAQSRAGYSALPPSMTAGGTALHPFEVPLLAALESHELPQGFGFASSALHFRGLKSQLVCGVVLDVPLANVTFQKSDTEHVKGRLAYVILLKDAQGEVVKKLENDLPLVEPAARLEALKTTHFIYTSHFDLPPGTYGLETAVLDGESNKISTSKSSVTMPVTSGLAISSVSIVRSTRERGAATDDGDPFLVGTKVISPTLDPLVKKAGTNSLPFYFVIYADKNITATPQLVMEFSRNGKVLGSGVPPLGAPDKDGRIPYIAMTPLERLEPGNFTVRFIVKQGPETAEETASFTLQ